MPYSSVADIPQSVKDNLPKDPTARRQWLHVFNSAMSACEKGGGKDCESRAFAQANGVLKKQGKLNTADHSVGSVQVAAFALEAAAVDAGDFTERGGLVFRAGDYPDKAFSVTTDELAEAAREFEPVLLTLEHVPTVLDGQLGQLTSVIADGEELVGTAALPKWLDDLLDDGSRKISLEWDRANKRIVGGSLVLNPRVSDAALMSAYATFAGRRNSSTDQESIQKVHDLTNTLGADCSADHMPKRMGMGREKKMGTWDKIKAFFDANPDTARAVFDETEAPAEAPPSLPPPAQPPQPDPRVAQLEAKLAAMEAAARSNAAAAFADGVIAARKAAPAERSAIVVAFAQAAEDDAKSPVTVTFAEGKQGSRVDALRALYEARPAHILETEQLPANFNANDVLLSLGQPASSAQMTEERRWELLSYTPLGQSVLTERNGKGN